MKRLILFRHGKSDWDVSFAKDHARPLAGRGVRAARQMGKLLSKASRVPDLVVASTAVRARNTAEIAMEAGQWSSQLQLSDDLYASSPSRVLLFLQQLHDDPQTVMLVGHEPTWSGLVSRFTGANARMPTAAMAAMQFPVVRWKDLRFGSGELLWLLQPKFFRHFSL